MDNKELFIEPVEYSETMRKLEAVRAEYDRIERLFHALLSPRWIYKIPDYKWMWN